MAFSELFLDELYRRNDIVDVVSGYVQLTKKSGSNLFGLCPFHSEKTPSFAVNADRQSYHCFGCGKGGGVVNFIRDIENLSFTDAVHFLAKRAGMTVPDDKVSKETQSRRARILELNRQAARFFYDTLVTSPAGEGARQYLARREISKAMVTKFGLGAAPDSWSALMDIMLKEGFSRQELEEAGLIKASQRTGGGFYDAFRNRLMFPVIDVRGNVIGFSGRIIGDGEPKYLNSRDTAVFNKGRNLFALNLAKKSKSGMLILTEGNIDVVMLHQAGFDGAVASLGTALTDDQVRLMSNYTQNVVIAYDGDGAGVKATARALEKLEKANLNVRVISMEGAKDPDEYIKKFGRDAFSLLLESGEGHIKYRLNIIKSQYDLNTDDGRLGYLREATETLSKVGSAAEREIHGAHVAETVGISLEAVMNEINKAFKKRLQAGRKKEEARELNIRASIQPKGRSIRYENEQSAVAEQGVIRLLMRDSALFAVTEEYALSEADFSAPYLAKLYTMIRKRREEGLEPSASALANELDSEEASELIAILQKPETLSNGETAMRDYIKKIRAARSVTIGKEDPIKAAMQIAREKSGCGGKKNGE